MQEVSRYLVEHAQHLARQVTARAVVVYAEALGQDQNLCHLLQTVDFPAILVTRSSEIPALPGLEAHTWVRVPAIPMTRAGQVKTALLVCLAHGILRRGDRVICLAGVDGSSLIDSLMVLDLGSDSELFSLLDSHGVGADVAPAVFERVLTLATQLAVEGREGRAVGTLFVIGDSERVLVQSRSLVLNPFAGHAETQRNILNPALAETIKEFSALDGAFVIRGDGVVLSAGVQLVPTAPPVSLTGGLGTRHAAAAAITASTDAVAVCVSQSTGTVSVYKSGRLVTDIHRPTGSDRLVV